jgi:peptidoglycan L-alanyl-D-glutamate endopeptidase CwlK
MSFALSARDRTRLKGVHPDLVRVVERAVKQGVRFMVIEGIRTKARQTQLVARGASKTMNSRHIPAANGYGHAVDIAPLDPQGNVSWAWPDYYPLAAAVKAAAKACGVPIEWGGDWKSFKDGPHWQLPWRQYPGTKPVSDRAQQQPLADAAPPADWPKEYEPEVPPKPLVKSKIAQGSATVATVEVGDAVATANDTLDKLATAKDATDRIGITDQVMAVMTNPRVIIAILVVVICAGIIYWRWREHGRGQ